MNNPSNKKPYGIGTIAKELERLDKQYKKGILSKEELNIRKRKLLNALLTWTPESK